MSRPALRWAPFVVAVLAMIATPLFSVAGDERVALASIVIVAWCAFAFVDAVGTSGAKRALGALAAVVVVTAGVEVLGSRTGVPFGAYDYTGRLVPTVFDVPVIVPLAWFAVGLFAREVAVAVTSRRSARVLLGAFALTAWDLFLDPQMVAEGYWRWAEAGWYRGIPVENYLGWFVTGIVVMSILERSLPPRESASRGPVAAYAVIAALQTVGFAAFFDDPVVALVGGAGMVPIATLACVRTFRRGGVRVVA